MRKLLTILLLISLGCKAPQQSTSSNTSASADRKDSVVYVETIRKVPYPVPGEKVTVEVQVPCDTNKIVKGATQGSRTQLKYKIEKGRLDIVCTADSLLLEIAARDTYIMKLKADVRLAESSTVKTVYITKTVVKKRTPPWNWLLMLALLAFIFRKPLFDLIKPRLPWI